MKIERTLLPGLSSAPRSLAAGCGGFASQLSPTQTRQPCQTSRELNGSVSLRRAPGSFNRDSSRALLMPLQR